MRVGKFGKEMVRKDDPRHVCGNCTNYTDSTKIKHEEIPVGKGICYISDLQVSHDSGKRCDYFDH